MQWQGVATPTLLLQQLGTPAYGQDSFGDHRKMSPVRQAGLRVVGVNQNV